MYRSFSTLLFALTLTACASVGPSTVTKDQFNYNEAIATASQEQLLMNMVRLRYSETPTFMKVSSVINQYQLSTRGTANAGLNTGVTGDNTASVGGSVRWADKPTITYLPVTGQEFARDLLTPLQPYQLFEMMQAGWPVELIMRVAMLNVNGQRNDATRPSRRRQADAEFYEMFNLWQQLGQADVLGFSRDSSAEGQILSMYVDESRAADLMPQLDRFRTIMGIDPGVAAIELVYGKGAKPNQIAVLTGSVWDIMARIAWQLNVPPEHVESGRTASTFTSTSAEYRPTIRIEYSRQRPDSAFAAVFAHDHWFYIDQNDRQSKRVFSFLELLLNLAQSDVGGMAPVVTISN